MKTLLNKTQNQKITENLKVAESFTARLVGLLKHEQLEKDEVLWIHRCNSIHTFFMKFSLDVVFVDKNLKIKKIIPSVKPFRITFPILSADSVFEMNDGFAKEHNLKEGDQLYVGP